MREGWEIKSLKEISDYSIGLTYSPKEVSDKGIVVLRSANIQNGRLDFDDLVRVEKKVKDELIVKDGDILMCARNGSKRLVGKTAVIKDLKEEMTFGTFMMIIRSEFNPYLSWFFNSEGFYKQIAGGENTMINQITRYMLDDVKVPIPSLPEQQRIVSILDKTFAAIDKAKANLQQNLQNAKELFESYLQNVFENKGDDWEEKRLDEVFLIKPPKSEAKEKLKENEAVTFLPMEDLEVLNYEVNPVKERKLNEVIGSYTYFADGDVLLAKITPCFENGKIGIAKNLTNGIGFGSSEYIVFRSKNEVTPAFLYYFLSRSSFRQEGAERMTGAVGHKRVSKDFIEDYKITFPKSVKKQNDVVNEINRLANQKSEIEKVYQQKLSSLDELKKSILQKAFAGELTASTKPLIAQTA